MKLTHDSLLSFDIESMQALSFRPFVQFFCGSNPRRPKAGGTEGPSIIEECLLER